MARGLLPWLGMTATHRKPDPTTTSLHRWKRAGLFSGLESQDALVAKEGGDESVPTSLFRRYYAAEGDMVEAVWRRQADRFVDVSRSQRPDTVVKLVELALPGVGPLEVTSTPGALRISDGSEEVSISRGVGRYQLRSAPERPRDVIEAINVLLSKIGLQRRFVELSGTSGRHMFVALEPQQARALQSWGATRHADVGTLWRFTGWDRVVMAARAS